MKIKIKIKKIFYQSIYPDTHHIDFLQCGERNAYTWQDESPLDPELPIYMSVVAADGERYTYSDEVE